MSDVRVKLRVTGKSLSKSGPECSGHVPEDGLDDGAEVAVQRDWCRELRWLWELVMSEKGRWSGVKGC